MALGSQLGSPVNILTYMTDTPATFGKHETHWPEGSCMEL